MMRERKKKQKADEKRQRKLERKAAAEAGPASIDESTGDAEISEDGESAAPEIPSPETESIEE